MRRRNLRPDRFGGDTTQRVFIEGIDFRAKHTPQIRILQGLLQSSLCFGEREYREGKQTSSPPPCTLPHKWERELDCIVILTYCSNRILQNHPSAADKFFSINFRFNSQHN